MKLPP
ncbi:uncharacterized protein FFE2_16037 [Fusarium fujikuroi]